MSSDPPHGTFAPGIARNACSSIGSMPENPNDATPPGLRRSRLNQVLGGVCAGVANRLGVDAVLVRIAAVAAALVSGGAAILLYLIAWVVLPQDDEGPLGVLPPVGRGHAREAWSAAGDDVRSLASSLRQDPTEPVAETERQKQSRAAAIDGALTSLGDLLRDPEVRVGARRAATGVSTAVGASVDELAARARRTR